MQSRAISALIIVDVINRQVPLNLALETQLKNHPSKDRPFIQDLCYGVFRWLPRLDSYLNVLIDKNIRKKDMDIRALIWLGLYQIIYQRTPEHAAVSATVDACRELKKPWAKNLVNAILRRYLREAENLLSDMENNPVSEHAHPEWIIKQLRLDWPDDWQSITSANLLHPPLVLRINQNKINRQSYSDKLNHVAIEHSVNETVDSAITLNKACDITQLPGYEEGEFSVQDSAAQLAAGLLDLQTDQTVLDACAAPGGKTAHILESQNELKELIAVEIDAARTERIRENLNRLGLSANVITADACQPQSWWDKQPFDRILLDAPCSASGIIRRHPDIKSLRQSEDVTELCQLQKQMLEQLWPLLKSGGKLLYSTCSVFKCENEKQIEQFIQQHDDAVEEKITASWGSERDYGRQILSGDKNMDGFYYALINKQ